MTEELAGAVVGLWRYPVKSMLGERLDVAAVGAGGVAGDRAYALIDVETGAVASAKHPRKWARLLACSAAFVAEPSPGAPPPPVRITLPDGSATRSDSPDVDAVLSRLLGRQVRLRAQGPGEHFREADRSPPGEAGAEPQIRREPLALGAPPGSFFDYGTLHLLATSTLDRLEALAPGSRFAPQRFRPNILVAPVGDTEGFVERGWLGQSLSLGDGVALFGLDPCPRCVVTTLAHGDLGADPGVLRAVAAHSEAPSVTLAPGVVFQAVAGLYASVVAGGTIRVGDGLSLRGGA